MKVKFVSFATETAAVRPGVIFFSGDATSTDDATIVPLSAYLEAQGLPVGATLQQAIAAFPDLTKRMEALGERLEGERIPLARARLVSPIPRPTKNVFCVGRNYRAHVSEASAARGKQSKIPEHPQYFTKPPLSVIGPFDDIPLHEGLTEALDYEAELGVVIGRPGVNIAPGDVFDHVFGYTVINDVTARDLQKRHDRWLKGKGLDGTCPMGPWIVPAEYVRDPADLELHLTVNGETRQQAPVRDMIFDVVQLVSVLSEGLTLEPGDIIATGTPSGVGFAMQPPRLLADGDVVEVSISDLGGIRNTVRRNAT